MLPLFFNYHCSHIVRNVLHSTLVLDSKDENRGWCLLLKSNTKYINHGDSKYIHHAANCVVVFFSSFFSLSLSVCRPFSIVVFYFPFH